MDLNTAVRISGQRIAIPQTGAKNGVADDTFFGMVMDAVTQPQAAGAREAAGTQAASLKEMLKARYPGLVYHVFDGSSRYWQTREDYPFHLLYQKNIDTEALENWTPTGPNPDQTSPAIQRNMALIPPGSKAVIIHPKVQERMEQDPEYAKEIMNRIEAWFTFDVARNEAIIPGITVGMSQSIAIGEDGSIVNVQSSTGPDVTHSKKNDSDDEPDFWELRANRHAYFMQLWKKALMEHDMEVTGRFAALQSGQAAKAHLVELLNSDELKQALGDTLFGIPLEQVFAQTRQAVFGTALL